MDKYTNYRISNKLITNPLVILSLLFIMSILALPAQADKSSPKASLKFYKQAYGLINPNSKPEVLNVFNKVKAVADKNDKYWPKLAIIKDTQKASIFVLKDGHIVISEKALDIIYQGVNLKHAQARLAFVFGHELAHLATDDFWDHEISKALTTTTGGNLSEITSNNAADRKIKEIRADDFGFLYAALAGYPVNLIIDNTSESSDFFSFWSEKTGNRSSTNYPQPKTRAKVLRSRLAEKLESITYFNFGVRLAHFGHYDQAIKFLTEFQRQFPSREVFNNLAFCYLQKAIKLMEANHAYYYWLPTVADTNTLLSELRLSINVRGMVPSSEKHFNRRRNPEIQNLLGDAIRNLNKSIIKDSQYTPAYINLAVANFYMAFESHRHEYHIKKALEAAEIAYQLQQNVELETLRAVILFFDKSAQTSYDRSLTDLIDKMPQLKNSPTAVNYNLARLLSDHQTKKKNKLATQYWKKVNKEQKTLPNIILSTLCIERRSNRAAKFSFDCPQQDTSLTPLPPIKPSIDLGRDLLHAPVKKIELKKNNLQRKEILGETVFYSKDQTIFALDDYIAIAVVKNTSDKPITKSTLRKYSSTHTKKYSLANGVLWHYGSWAALVKGTKVEEIWLNANTWYDNSKTLNQKLLNKTEHENI